MSDTLNILDMHKEEAALKSEWGLGDYTGKACVNCGRNRVCKTGNGKTRCEKCNWVEADNFYAPINIDF